MLYAVTGSSAMSWLSPGGNLRQLGNVVFRMRPLYPDTPWIVSLLMILALIGVSMLVLDKRVRGVEGVS